MADVHSRKVRSYNMSQIKSTNTTPEVFVRRFLFSKGYRYRLHDNKLPGKPDIVLKGIKTIIFVHGCFWHGHKGCKYFTVPKTRTKWWLNKINGNIENDKLKQRELRQLGWQIITIWECQLKPGSLDQMHEKLLIELQKRKYEFKDPS
jgi:DNA mismatch endonuclease, patch repair protein